MNSVEWNTQTDTHTHSVLYIQIYLEDTGSMKVVENLLHQIFLTDSLKLSKFNDVK